MLQFTAPLRRLHRYSDRLFRTRLEILRLLGGKSKLNINYGENKHSKNSMHKIKIKTQRNKVIRLYAGVIQELFNVIMFHSPVYLLSVYTTL